MEILIKHIKETIKEFDLLEEHIDLSCVSCIYDAEQEGLFVVDKDELEEGLQDYINQSVEIIYYASAMDFLRENDTSLNHSLSLAHDMGFTCDNLNSEKLATILLQDMINDELSEFLNELEEHEELTESDE